MPASSKWEAKGATIPARRCVRHGARGLNDAGNWGSLNPESALPQPPHLLQFNSWLEQTSLGISWSCWADLGSTVPHGDDPVMSQGA